MDAESLVRQLPAQELEMKAVRASGPGGQNVNKVATAIHLRFDIRASSLPDAVKTRLLRLRDRRISRDGVVVIKAQRFRDQDKNRQDALSRLTALVQKATERRTRRIPTKPPRASNRKRLDAKTRRGQVKRLRGPVKDAD